MNNNYSIGVVTYHARYEKYFVPLIQKLAVIFPDKEIICIINGHPDRTLQINYLKKVTTFLEGFQNVRYLTYDLHQSLSKCWNQLVILSNTEKVLILNDDTQVTELFRQEFEEKVVPLPFSIMNVSWSHFLTSKDIIKKVGWFDERLLGVGHEDADYALRMGMVGIPMTDTECLGLDNYVVDQENAGWKNISAKLGGSKYSEINSTLFKEKWITQDGHPEMKRADFKYEIMWNNTPYRYSLLSDTPTPLFYNYDCLDIKNETSNKYYQNEENKFKIILQKVFYACRQLLKKIYRKIVK